MALCLTPGSPELQISVDHLEAACARAAPTLRHLKLCVEHALPNLTSGSMDKVILGPALTTSPVCTLRSLSLVAVRCSTNSLFHIIEANASLLRHVYLETVTVKAKLIQRLAQLTALKLDTLQVVKDTSDLRCEHALVRFINGEEPSKDSFCCPFEEDRKNRKKESNHCDKALRKHIEGGSNNQIATAQRFLYFDSSESDSDTDSDLSEDSIDSRRRAAPKWIWARFFNTNDDEDSPASRIYCYHMSDSHPKGHETELWKFTSRSGETAYGVDPLDWFDDWDLEAGDIEEPTPYCEALRKFFFSGKNTENVMGSIANYLGEGSKAWDLIKEQKPPQDAFYYDPDVDPTRSSNMFRRW